MSAFRKIKVANGVYWLEVPEAQLYVLCGCPADSVKFLMKRGLIVTREKNGIAYETGPNAIVLSDVLVQNGSFANLAEFPVLQMLYRQGMILPNHPNNTGAKPVLIGSREQVHAQMEYIFRGNYGLLSESYQPTAHIASVRDTYKVPPLTIPTIPKLSTITESMINLFILVSPLSLRFVFVKGCFTSFPVIPPPLYSITSSSSYGSPLREAR